MRRFPLSAAPTLKWTPLHLLWRPGQSGRHNKNNYCMSRKIIACQAAARKMIACQAASGNMSFAQIERDICTDSKPTIWQRNKVGRGKPIFWQRKELQTVLASGVSFCTPTPGRRLSHDSYVSRQCRTTRLLHSAGLAAAACKRSVEPAIATASANTSAAHVVRALPRVRHPARPTLCRRASRMGAPTGAAAHRPASTNCCTRMREDSFMLQAAPVNTSALETRLMKAGGMLQILRRHFA